MKVKLKIDTDGLYSAEEFEVIKSTSDLVTPLNHDVSYFETMYLLRMPDGIKSSIRHIGHTSYTTVPAWWISFSSAEIIEFDTPCGVMKIGQRWQFHYNTTNFIVEIIKLPRDPGDKGAIEYRAVQSIMNGPEINAINSSYFTDTASWTYLTGQDKPR